MEIQQIRDALKASGKTAREFAEHVGINESGLSLFLSGKRKLTQIQAALFKWYFKANKIKTW